MNRLTKDVMVDDTLILKEIEHRIKDGNALVVKFNSLRTKYVKDYKNTSTFETTEKLIRDCILRHFKYITTTFTINHTSFNREAATRASFNDIDNSSLFDHSCGWALYVRTNTEEIG
jgi:hypothetical protein